MGRAVNHALLISLLRVGATAVTFLLSRKGDFTRAVWPWTKFGHSAHVCFFSWCQTIKSDAEKACIKISDGFNCRTHCTVAFNR